MSVRVPLCDKSLFKGVQSSRLHCIVLKTGRILCAHRDSYLGGKNVRNKRSIKYHHWAVKALPSLSLFTLKPPPGKIRWANLKAATEDINENFCAQAVVSSEEAWDWWTFCQPSLGGSGLMKKISFKLWNGPRFDAFQAPLCPPLAETWLSLRISFKRTHTSGEIWNRQSFKLGYVTLCMQEWRSNSASHFKVKCWVERLRELFLPGQKASKLLALYQLWQGAVNFTAKSALPFGEAVLSAEKREAVFISDSKVFFRGRFDWGPKIRTVHRVAEVQLWGQSTGMFYSAATQHVQQHDSGKGSCKDHCSYWPNRDSSGQKLRAFSADGFTVVRC